MPCRNCLFCSAGPSSSLWFLLTAFAFFRRLLPCRASAACPSLNLYDCSLIVFSLVVQTSSCFEPSVQVTPRAFLSLVAFTGAYDWRLAFWFASIYVNTVCSHLLRLLIFRWLRGLLLLLVGFALAGQTWRPRPGRAGLCSWAPSSVVLFCYLRWGWVACPSAFGCRASSSGPLPSTWRSLSQCPLFYRCEWIAMPALPLFGNALDRPPMLWLSSPFLRVSFCRWQSACAFLLSARFAFLESTRWVAWASSPRVPVCGIPLQFVLLRCARRLSTPLRAVLRRSFCTSSVPACGVCEHW